MLGVWYICLVVVSVLAGLVWVSYVWSLDLFSVVLVFFSLYCLTLVFVIVTAIDNIVTIYLSASIY